MYLRQRPRILFPSKNTHWRQRSRFTSMTAIALGLLLTVGHAANPSSKNASVEEIAQQMASANRKRSEQLAGYTARRRYSVSYRGFPSSLSAEMVVDVTYVAPLTKSFRVVSHTRFQASF